jgi:hypothetical protein
MARPAAVAADGNIRVAWCTTLTTSAPTAAQCTSGVDLSYYLTPDGLTPSLDQQQITDDRLADQQTFEAPGRFKLSLNELKFVVNPTSAPDNAALTALTNGATGFLVVRWGIAAGTAFAAAQKIDFWPLTIGITLKQPPEQNSVLKATTKVFVTNTVVQDIALA